MHNFLRYVVWREFFSLGYLVWGYQNSQLERDAKFLRGMHNILGYMEWRFQISWDAKYLHVAYISCCCTTYI